MIIHNLPGRKQLEKLNNSFTAPLSKERSGKLNPAFRLQLPLGSSPPRKIPRWIWASRISQVYPFTFLRKTM